MSEHICNFLQKSNLASLIWRYYVNEFAPDWQMESMHTHRAFELITILNGSGTMEFSGASEKLIKNHSLMILPDVSHQFFVGKESACTLINIHFIVEETPLWDFLCSSATDAADSQNSLIQTGYLKLNGNHAIGEAMLSIVNELETRKPKFESVVKLRFSELFIQMERVITNAGKLDNSNKKAYVREAKQIIEKNLSDNLSPEYIAQILHISAGYLMHVFKEYTGYSLMSYVHFRRMEKSKILLYETNATITNVASVIGISNSQYFSVLFKSYTGMTPREFRKASRLRNISNSNIFT